MVYSATKQRIKTEVTILFRSRRIGEDESWFHSKYSLVLDRRSVILEDMLYFFENLGVILTAEHVTEL